MIQLKTWLFVLALALAASIGGGLGVVIAKQGPAEPGAVCPTTMPQPGVSSGKELKRGTVENTQRDKEY